MNLTNEELAVVKAMRLGAKVNIGFHWLQELDEVDERMNLFTDIKITEHSWINENEREDGEPYIAFHKGMDGIKATCFLEIKKVTPPESNE